MQLKLHTFANIPLSLWLCFR